MQRKRNKRVSLKRPETARNHPPGSNQETIHRERERDWHGVRFCWEARLSRCRRSWWSRRSNPCAASSPYRMQRCTIRQKMTRKKRLRGKWTERERSVGRLYGWTNRTLLSRYFLVVPPRSQLSPRGHFLVHFSSSSLRTMVCCFRALGAHGPYAP